VSYQSICSVPDRLPCIHIDRTVRTRRHQHPNMELSMEIRHVDLQAALTTLSVHSVLCNGPYVHCRQGFKTCGLAQRAISHEDQAAKCGFHAAAD